MKEQDISFFKFIFTLAAFVFELPSGYLSDKFGNRLCLLLSRLFSIASLLFYCVSPNFVGFLMANFLLGMADAWESGAKDSYFLMLCQDLNTKHNIALEYREIKISVTKSSYWLNFVLMFFSTFLYNKNIFYPFIGSVALLTVSAFIILTLPPDKTLTPQKSEKKLFLQSSHRAGKMLLRQRNKPESTRVVLQFGAGSSLDVEQQFQQKKLAQQMP